MGVTIQVLLVKTVWIELKWLYSPGRGTSVSEHYYHLHSRLKFTNNQSKSVDVRVWDNHVHISSTNLW